MEVKNSKHSCNLQSCVSIHFDLYSTEVENCDGQLDQKQSEKSCQKKNAKMISPKLLACKVEVNTVEMPPALKQRNIQIQALESARKSGELLSPQHAMPFENQLKHRKKAVVVEDVNQSSSTGNTTSDDDSGPDEGSFETYLVIEFSADISKKTLHWIIDKIRTKTSRGGAGLLVKREPQLKYAT